MRNKSIKLLALLGLFIMLASGAFAAGTTSGTVTVNDASYGGGEWYITSFTCTSDASGNVVSNIINVPGIGVLKAAIFDPETSAPSDNWDVTIKDVHGSDILLGFGANHDTANTENIFFSGNLGSVFSTTTLVHTVDTLNKFYPWEPVVNGRLTIAVTNAGDTKTLTIKLMFKLK